MNKVIKLSYLFIVLLCTGCDSLLDNDLETELKPEQVYVNYDRMRSVANGAYTYLDIPAGFYHMGGSLRATTTDEAVEASYNTQVQKFNLGIWNKFSNPDDVYNQCYEAIRQCNMFLENSTDYKSILATDTVTATGKANYQKYCDDINWYRHETRFLRAFYHFELVKRYGGIPLVKKVLNSKDNSKIPRSTFSECVNYITEELDDIKNNVVEDWLSINSAERQGRVTKGAVLALKSRILLYAASLQNNPEKNREKWIIAAEAAREIIDMDKYSLYSNYQNLFLAPQSYNCSEIIMYYRYTNSNTLEKANYPIGTPGGKSGVSPSQNLVDAYEHLSGWDEKSPYQNIDPRLGMTIVLNNTSWNGRTIESYIGGKDGMDQKNASPTGYYLKKFLSPNLDLAGSPEGVSMKAWILFRYGEVLLNYAEAMNEAYGPATVPPNYKYSALQAINILRKRTGVALPELTITDKDSFREAIYRERRVELAFEDHRMWDLRRWNKGSTLGDEIKGVEIIKDTDCNEFNYEYITVQKRIYDNSKMNLYPIPQSEINKYPDILKQNPNW
ncbi:RagB/SusD family nutrient uptake outer membrane protein [uncultured Dysgonomonas sp.]|uniref:RagB/SusD family nutrient uptake outer membrane protein n=1 Tax=uncultured Dysgonomonas sp. TaxID=206096 RepID=A0A212JCP1_9BACT|nr:RagB/SusD family nutrient uptake outer membrane protein [uncultured Dysgonomonas sp.]SBV97233.1 conserved hypothetical protein [uncultured Dysgonomonas sp.]